MTEKMVLIDKMTRELDNKLDKTIESINSLREARRYALSTLMSELVEDMVATDTYARAPTLEETLNTVSKINRVYTAAVRNVALELAERVSPDLKLQDDEHSPSQTATTSPAESGESLPAASIAVDALYTTKFSGVLNDDQIRHLAETQQMITPFVDHQVRTNEHGAPVISYGLSSCGYDIRLSGEFMLFDKTDNDAPIDPKNFKKEDHCTKITASSIIVPPGALLLARTVEYFKIPRNVIAVCMGKSTLARCGALVNVTPLEPEWEGELVVEITNGSQKPLIIYANEGVGQLVFHYNGFGCNLSYADRRGKYQGQRGITTAKI